MFSLVLHGRRSVTELQKWRHLGILVNLLQNSSVFPNSFSSATASNVSPRDDSGFMVSYLVGSLGLSTKLAESISRNVSFKEKRNPDSVLKLLRSYGFTNSQISSIITSYPGLLVSDAEKSLDPKLKFLQSRGASTSEFTQIVSTVPKILGKKEGKASSVYYDFIKEIIEADKSSKFQKLRHSLLPKGSQQENKIRNISVLRELGMPQKLLFSMLISNFRTVCGKERFEESLKKVVEMGFDPTTSKFVDALNSLYQISDKTIQEKLNVFKKLGFAEGDVWEIFKKFPGFLGISEKKLLNLVETFLGLGFSRDEFVILVKRFPKCLTLSVETVKKKTEFLVKKMNWPLKVVALYPHVLGYNLETRIKPRCNVIEALMSKGLLGCGFPPISSVFACTDEVFLKRYVRKHDDQELVLMDIFNERRSRAFFPSPYL